MVGRAACTHSRVVSGMTYERFAAIYDEVMDEQLYTQWLDFTARHIPISAQLLELACGTGKLAVAFAQKGYQVTGLDLSEEMLMIAAQRMEAAQVQMQLVQGDMLDLSAIGQYDVVTCFSDSLCYMQDEKQVQRVFHEVYQALNEQGVFLFDVHSIYQMTEVFPFYQYHYQTDDFAFLWESYAGEQLYSVEHFLTFFTAAQQADCFVRHDELHKERTYPIATYVKMLEQAGFVQVDVFADFTDQAPTETSKRWFFVGKKGNK